MMDNNVVSSPYDLEGLTVAPGQSTIMQLIAIANDNNLSVFIVEAINTASSEIEDSQILIASNESVALDLYINAVEEVRENIDWDSLLFLAYEYKSWRYKLCPVTTPEQH